MIKHDITQMVWTGYHPKDANGLSPKRLWMGCHPGVQTCREWKGANMLWTEKYEWIVTKEVWMGFGRRGANRSEPKRCKEIVTKKLRTCGDRRGANASWLKMCEWIMTEDMRTYCHQIVWMYRHQKGVKIITTERVWI